MQTQANKIVLAGALKKAAETTQKRLDVEEKARDPTKNTNTARRKVGVSVVEAYGKEVNPRELEATLRMEYRTKLLNPKWAESMAKQVGVHPACSFNRARPMLAHRVSSFNGSGLVPPAALRLFCELHANRRSTSRLVPYTRMNLVSTSSLVQGPVRAIDVGSFAFILRLSDRAAQGLLFRKNSLHSRRQNIQAESRDMRVGRYLNCRYLTTCSTLCQPVTGLPKSRSPWSGSALQCSSLLLV